MFCNTITIVLNMFQLAILFRPFKMDHVNRAHLHGMASHCVFTLHDVTLGSYIEDVKVANVNFVL